MDAHDLLDHESRLFAVASRLVGPAEANDVVQETFLRALAVRPNPSRPLQPWLVRVAKNLALDVLRRRARFEEVGEIEVLPADPDPTPLEALLPVLGGLSDGEVVVLLLREVLDLSVDEVATALETTAGSVRVLHSRGRARARAAPPELDKAPVAIGRFLAWLLARQVVGLPVRQGPSPDDPGWTSGVLAAHGRLLDAMAAVAARAGRPDLELPARLMRADAHAALGEDRPAADGYARGVALAAAIGRPMERAYARYRRACELHKLGQHAEARSEVERGLAELDGAPHDGADAARLRRYRASLRSELVHLATDEGRMDEVAAVVAAMRADVAPDAAERALLLNTEATVAIEAERWEEAERALLEAGSLVRTLGHPRAESAVLSNLGVCALGRGDLDAAVAWLDHSRVLAARIGDRRQLALTDSNLAVAVQLSGDRAEAAVRWHRVIADWSALEMPAGEAEARLYAGALDHVEGRLNRAELGLQAALDRLEAPTGTLRERIEAHLAAVRRERDGGPAPGPTSVPAGPPGLALAVAALGAPDPAGVARAEAAPSVIARLAAQVARAVAARRG